MVCGARQGDRRASPRDRLFCQRDTEILRLFEVERSHQAIFQQICRLADGIVEPPTEKPSRVAVDETAIKINSELLGCIPESTSGLN